MHPLHEAINKLEDFRLLIHEKRDLYNQIPHHRRKQPAVIEQREELIRLKDIFSALLTALSPFIAGYVLTNPSEFQPQL